MKIAILGGGNVGGALGGSWAQAGHQITFGLREPRGEKARALLAQTSARASNASSAVSASDVAGAVKAAEIVALATPWNATLDVIAAAGDLGGKILIDCTNPLKFTAGVGLELTLGFTDSGGETVARAAKSARVVKAFNTYGWENFANAAFPNAAALRPLMMLAGDDADAKASAGALAADIGFEPFDAGPLRAARELEPLALLWIRAASSGSRSPHFTWARLTR